MDWEQVLKDVFAALTENLAANPQVMILAGYGKRMVKGVWMESRDSHP